MCAGTASLAESRTLLAVLHPAASVIVAIAVVVVVIVVIAVIVVIVVVALRVVEQSVCTCFQWTMISGVVRTVMPSTVLQSTVIVTVAVIVVVVVVVGILLGMLRASTLLWRTRTLVL